MTSFFLRKKKLGKKNEIMARAAALPPEKLGKKNVIMARAAALPPTCATAFLRKKKLGKKKRVSRGLFAAG